MKRKVVDPYRNESRKAVIYCFTGGLNAFEIFQLFGRQNEMKREEMNDGVFLPMNEEIFAGVK